MSDWPLCKTARCNRYVAECRAADGEFICLEDYCEYCLDDMADRMREREEWRHFHAD